MSPRRRSAGFSLVELMVAMLIGLFGTIVIFQVFSLSERQRRLTAGASDAQQNGLLALYSIEREARVAGYGFSYPPLLGCSVTSHDQTGPRDFTFLLTAAQITDGAAGAPDALTFAYGNSGVLVSPAKLFGASAVGAVASQVDNPYGYNRGDLIVIGQAGAGCVLREITANPANNATSFQLDHVPGNYTAQSGIGAASRYNKAGGLPIAFAEWDNVASTGGRLFSLGNRPVVGTYSVAGNQLVYQNVLTSTAGTPIVDGIVQLQAQYGRDTNTDGIVDVWQATPAPATAADWQGVIALRMAVVARSVDRERPTVDGPCSSTTTGLTWAGGAITLTDPEWQCYRYRVFETKVPIRNLIWLP